MILRGNLNVSGKTQKSVKLLAFEWKNKLHILIKISMTVLPLYKIYSVVSIFSLYKIKFIESAKFMAASLSGLTDNLPEGIHKIKCKYCDFFLEYESVKVNNIEYI